MARREGKHFVINGARRFIANAPQGGVFTVLARTDPETRTAACVTAFLVETSLNYTIEHKQFG